MRIRILIVSFTLLISTSTWSQLFSAAELIKNWSASDSMQTILAEETYDDLYFNTDSSRFAKLIAELHKKIDDGGDKRLVVRLLMYEILGIEELRLSPLKDEEQLLLNAIRIVNQLRDEQLLSELYSLYANIRGIKSSHDKMLLYNLKTIEIQRRIGVHLFPKIYLRYLSLNIALYNIGRYREALDAGLLGITEQKRNNVFTISRLLQYDYIASCYKELGMADSVLYYYFSAKDIIDNIHDKKKAEYLDLWKGIIDGGIGQGYFLQQKYDEAIPLLQKNIQSSINSKQWADAVLAQNTLSEIYHNQQQYALAIKGWHNANYWLTLEPNINYLTKTFKGIAGTYLAIGNNDSARYYYNQYYHYTDTLNRQMQNTLYALTQGQVAFDELQASLRDSREKLSREKNTRNAIILLVILVAIICLILYNRKQLQQKWQLQWLEQKNKNAAQTIVQARQQINDFRQHIIEKNQLISDLQDKQPEDETIHNRLMGYVFITDHEWEKFKSEFEKVRPDFLHKLNQQLNGSTLAEEKMATLIYLRLDNYQIANTLGISKESVTRAKRRLKQRLQLETDTDLENYIQEI